MYLFEIILFLIETLRNDVKTHFPTPIEFFHDPYIPQFNNNITLNSFQVHIIGDLLVQTRTVDGLLLLIDQERSGDTVDRSLLKSLLRMLSDLGIYHEAFEIKYFTLKFPNKKNNNFIY